MPQSTLAKAAQSLKAGITQAQTDGMVIKAYQNAIRTQGDIITDYAPGLPATQQQARDNATFWDTEVWPAATQNVTDLLSFSSAWMNYKVLLEQYAQTIASTTATQQQKDEARNNLDLLLGRLYNDVNTKYENTEVAGRKLQQYYTTIMATDKQFDQELTALQTKFAGKSGVIAQLDGEIDSLQDSMGKDVALIVGGCVTTAAGIGLIIVGAACEFESAGTSTGVIVTGVGTLIAGVGAIAGASVDYNNKVNDVANLIAEKTEDEAMYAGVKTAIAQVTSLNDKCEAAVNSTRDLAQHWADLKTEISTLRQDIKTVNPGDFGVQAKIAEASSDFSEILDTCRAIQTAFSGGNPPTNTRQVNTQNFPTSKAA